MGFYDGTDGTAVTNGCTNSGKVSATVNSSNANIGAGGIAGIIKSGHATNNTNDGAVWMHNAQAGKSSYAGGIVGYDYNTKDKSAVTGNVNNGAVQATVEGTSALLAPGASSGATTWAPCPDAGISARWHVRCMRGRSWAGTRKAWRTAPQAVR